MSDSLGDHGMPSSRAIHDGGLSTVIGDENRDSSGKSITPKMKKSIQRLRAWNTRTQVNEQSDRNMRSAFTELKRITDKLQIPQQIIEKSSIIYREALKKGLVRGRSITYLILASLYLACRESETPRTLKEIARESGLKKKDIARCYRLLVESFDIKVPRTNPIKCVSRIASDVNISEGIKRRAIEILTSEMGKSSSVGKDTMGMAAAAVYYASILGGEPKTQGEIARVAGVTEVTIRNRYRSMLNEI